MNKNILFLMAVLNIWGCSKDEDLDLSPEIKFEAISPDVVTENEDQLSLEIWYRDNDGDLGENNPDVKNLFVIDQRNNVTFAYRVQQLAPNTSDEIRIQGTFNIQLGSQIIVDGKDEVSFKVYVIDRAGNQSNTITTPSIKINAQ